MADVCRSCGIDTAAYGGGVRMSDGTVRCPGCETLVRLGIIDGEPRPSSALAEALGGNPTLVERVDRLEEHARHVDPSDEDGLGGFGG